MSTQLIKNVQRVSKLFQPIKIFPKDATITGDERAKSYRLMLDMGFIHRENPGMYSLLPLGYRVLEKLTAIIDNELANIGAQKMLLPHLTSNNLWKKSNRILPMAPELFKLKDRHLAGYILSPTHEEAISKLLATSEPLTKSQLPLLLYQISTKWRDEMKPRLGLFRGREFIMKDLYSFDSSFENAKSTYELVHKAYDKIFSQLDIPHTIANGSTGLMGGSLSHEYHYLSDMGEDVILHCTSCNEYNNASFIQESTENEENPTCKKCGEQFIKKSGIEVAHTFLLGNHYSKMFEAKYISQTDHIPYEMGCYGIGLTRLMAAAVEMLSTEESIKWPKSITPFTVCLIPPKIHSKEAEADHHVDRIIEMLSQKNIDFIVDDRTNLTIGRRMVDDKRTGFPYILIVGKSATLPEPTFELHDLHKAEQADMSMNQLDDFFDSIKRNVLSPSNQDEGNQGESNLKLKSLYVNISTIGK
ncbi:probable proline--tRNA ligase, mitochondrial [Chelonus insularis]|uniref:probable proline--tRNA ligase, mitochondrial n=1 Tax=Chelonus insularis TaxID=460826 RepID=UPI001589D31B|nr:probable proline--tRNA ligase, mitochondrial [Chelonus insularis]